MTSESQANPLVFVVGCPRSGTTLLQRMLDAHPQLAVANDTHFIPRAVDRVGLDRASALQAEHVEFVRNYRRTRRLGLSDDSFIPQARATTYPQYVAQLYQAFARANGKSLAGEKTPDYVKRIGLLHRLFPETKFVHIIRDGREVVQSLLEWSNASKGPAKLAVWREDPFAVATLWWAQQVSSGLRAGRRLPDLYYEVRYDTLVAHPEREMRSIAEFLGIPNSPAMSRFYQGKEIDDPSLSAKSAWRPATQGLRDKTSLTDRQSQMFELLCGDLLDDLGFVRLHASYDEVLHFESEQIRRRWQLEQARTARRKARKAQVAPQSGLGS